MSWLRFFAIGWGLPLSIYVVVQAAAIFTLRGRSRAAATVPLPLMLLVTAHMAWAYRQESNLWPMTMLMITPGAILGLVVIWVAALLATHRWPFILIPGALISVAVLAASQTDPGIGILWTGQETAAIAATVVALGVAVIQAARFLARRKGETLSEVSMDRRDGT
jgi:hypothetical protein